MVTLPTQPLDRQVLADNLAEALAFSNPATDGLSTDQFSARDPSRPDWAIGPFARADELTFTQRRDWDDPTGIGWTDRFVFNPTLIEHNDRLHLFYRASPRKESTASRIGHAVFDPSSGWSEPNANPIIYPTVGNEVLGCEDPKVYAAGGRFFLFYNGIWPISGTVEQRRYPSEGYPLGQMGCDINLAVSDDLEHWHKLGLAVPYPVSRLWAKGAVIPRNPAGEAVKINGDYLMFLSEGCNGICYVGRSTDLINWTFDEQPYLDLSELGGELLEVACATTGHNDRGDLVLDVFYRDAAGDFAAAQALYNTAAPFTQLALSAGGSLAWGGLTRYQDRLLFAQGWDAAEGTREMYFYRTGPPGLSKEQSQP